MEQIQTSSSTTDVPSFIMDIHKKYVRLANLHCCVYYTTRLVAGICSTLVPFAIKLNTDIATILSMAVVLSVTIDFIVNPRGKWQIYSKATDMLAVEEAKRLGNYEEYRELWEIITSTEAIKFERLNDIKEVLPQDKH